MGGGWGRIPQPHDAPGWLFRRGLDRDLNWFQHRQNVNISVVLESMGGAAFTGLYRRIILGLGFCPILLHVFTFISVIPRVFLLRVFILVIFGFFLFYLAIVSSAKRVV